MNIPKINIGNEPSLTPVGLEPNNISGPTPPPVDDINPTIGTETTTDEDAVLDLNNVNVTASNTKSLNAGKFFKKLWGGMKKASKFVGECLNKTWTWFWGNPNSERS